MRLYRSWRFCVAGFGLMVGPLACGSQTTVTSQPGDAGNAGDVTVPPIGSVTSPPPCGTLDPAGASQAVLNGIDSVLVPLVNAFAMVDTSATLARALTAGSSPSVSPVASTKNAIQSIRDTLANQWLVPPNVESASAGVVAFLVPPNVLCEGPSDGGAASNDGSAPSASASDGGDCASQLAAYPLRVRVYHVACDAGNDIEMDWLVGTDQQLLLAVEFDMARVYARVFFAPLSTDGLPLTSSTTGTVFSADGGILSSMTTTSASIVKLDPGATGALTATLEATDTGQTRAVLSVPEAISLGITADGGPHLGVGIGATSAIVDVTVGSGEMSGTLGLSDTSLTTTMSGFVQSEFGRSLVDAADPNQPVVVETSGFDGQFTYAVAGDTLTATGLGLGDAGAHAWYDGGDLIRVEVAPDAGGAVSFTAAANDAGVAVTFNPSFGLAIRYTMASVAPEVADLQAFASDDLFSITLSGGSAPSAMLFEDPNGSSPTALDLVGSQQGPLLQIGSGNLALTSTFAPDASVYLAAPQCLVRTPGQPGIHDILKDLSAAACP